MNRRLFLSLPLVFAGAYGFWVSRPRLENLEYLELLKAEAEEHLAQCQRMAASSETNGALSPVFEGFWDSTADAESLSDLRSLVDAMGKQSIYHDEPDDTSEAKAPESPAGLRARFQKYLPDLHLELAKPAFFSGKPSFDSSDMSFDLLACKNLAIALSVEATALASKGDYEGFVRCLRSILGLSRGYRAFSLLIRLMISHSIADVALQTVLHAYSPGYEAAPWAEVSRLLLEALPSREDLTLCMKCEFAFGDTFYQGVLDGNLPIEDLAEFGEELPFWKRLPGQVGRERRTYRRDIGEFIAALESGQSTSGLESEVAKKFDGHLRRLGVQYDFHRAAARAFEALAAGEKGDVSFHIEDSGVRIKIVSSQWVEIVGRRVLFRLSQKH